MVKTSKIEGRITLSSRNIIEANAKAANKSVTAFITHYAEIMTHDVQVWFDPLYQEYLKGKSWEEYAKTIRDKFMNTLQGFNAAMEKTNNLIIQSNEKIELTDRLIEKNKKNMRDFLKEMEQEREKMRHFYTNVEKIKSQPNDG